uniref:G patch domain containing 11 n=1 Tax=Sinocyclocheilus grahami TaxID=75366 RepID=A0A672L037_SINGR
MVKREKEALKKEALRKEKNAQNRQKSYKEQERESREAALQSSLSSQNKGFALLQKMGYKAGQGLGKQGAGRVEPVPLNIKTDRGGIGMEELKKRKADEELQNYRRKAQMKQQGEKKSIEDFRYDDIKSMETLIRGYVLYSEFNCITSQADLQSHLMCHMLHLT